MGFGGINRLIIQPLICLLAGIACIVIALTVWSVPKDYIETQATITSIESYTVGDETYHDVTVQYRVNGRTYNEELNVYDSSYKEGKEITIKFDPDDPTVIADASGLPKIIFLAFGIFLIFACAGQVLKALRT